MKLDLANANAVINARQFNASIVNQIWLVDHGMVQKEEFESGCVFTDVVAQVSTKRFALFVSPEKLQFTPSVPKEAQGELVNDVLGRFVDMLPHTPYTAVGLNFTWHLSLEDPENGCDLSRKLFFEEGRPLYRKFDAPEARFGGYLSKNALGARLRLDIKPILIFSGEREVETMQFAFNFHSDFSRESKPLVDTIKKFLARWDEAYQLCENILGSLEDDYNE